MIGAMKNPESLQILEIAIQAEGGNISQLARSLEVNPSTITNWRARGGVPHMTARYLKTVYAKQISAAAKAKKAAKQDQPTTTEGTDE